MLRNEANASPERFANWDPHRQFREEYHQRHLHDQTPDERLRNIEAHERGERTVSERSFPQEAVASPIREKEEEVASPLSRHSTSSASTASSASSASTHSARLEEIRTARSTPRDRRPTVNSQASSGNYLTLHPTERDPEAIRRIETHRSSMQVLLVHRASTRACRGPSRDAAPRSHCPIWELENPSLRSCQTEKNTLSNLTARKTHCTRRTGP